MKVTVSFEERLEKGFGEREAHMSLMFGGERKLTGSKEERFQFSGEGRGGR